MPIRFSLDTARERILWTLIELMKLSGTPASTLTFIDSPADDIFIGEERDWHDFALLLYFGITTYKMAVLCRH